MGWVRIDDNFPQHPKVAKAGPLGMAMQIAALCYCNRYLTDGFVPKAIVPGLLNLEGLGMRMWDGELFGGGQDATWQLVVEDLLDAGLWEEVDGGYQIHDYLDYQPSRAQILAEREATAKRVSEYRAKQKKEEKELDEDNGGNANVTPLQPCYYDVSNTTPNPNPNKDINTSTPPFPSPNELGEGTPTQDQQKQPDEPPAMPVKSKRQRAETPVNDSLFARFWAAYPKKRSKGQAERAWAKINPDEQLVDTMLAAIERAKKSEDWRKDGGRYIPYPATWLNAKGWEDDYEEAKPSPVRSGRMYDDLSAKIASLGAN